MADANLLIVKIGANLDALKAGLQAGKIEIDKTSTQLDSMIRSFDGSRTTKQAALMVEAIGGVENASKLTESQQQRVNRVMAEAVGLYAKMGQEAPPQLLAMRDATAKNETAWQKADEALGKFGLSLNSIIGVGAMTGLASAGVDVIHFGSHLLDLQAQTGLTTDELQRLNFAGSQVGLGIDQVASGISKFQKNLVEDGDKAAGALYKLGLSADQLLAMSPGQMFETMAEKLAAIPDPAQRTAIAIELLGKSGAELLPLLTANIKDLEAGASVMSKTTIENLDRLDDAWAKLKINVGSAIGDIIGKMTSLEGISVGVWDAVGGGNVSAVLDAWRDLTGGATDSAAAIEEVAKKQLKWGQSADIARPSIQTIIDLSNGMKRSFDDQQAAQKKATDEIDRLVDTLSGKAVADKVKALDAAVRDMVNKGLKVPDAEFPAFIQNLNKWELAGVPLTPMLQDIWAANIDMASSGIKVNSNVLDLIRNLPRLSDSWKDVDRATIDTQIAVDNFGRSIRPGSDLHTFLKGFPDLTPAVKRAWDQEIAQPARDAQWAHQNFLNAVDQEGDRFVHAIGHGFQGLKDAAYGVFNDILEYFERHLIDGMIESLFTGTNQMSGMFSGLAGAFGGGGGVAGTVAGAAGSAAGGGGGAAGGAAGAGGAAIGASLAIGLGVAGAAAGVVSLIKSNPFQSSAGLDLVADYARSFTDGHQTLDAGYAMLRAKLHGATGGDDLYQTLLNVPHPDTQAAAAAINAAKAAISAYDKQRASAKDKARADLQATPWYRVGDVSVASGDDDGSRPTIVQNITNNIDATNSFFNDTASLQKLTDFVVGDMKRALGDQGYA
jgi:hypothetical protein